MVPLSVAVWRTLVERLKVDLILATETTVFLLELLLLLDESVDDVSEAPRQRL
jgi:hypothetical protein